MTDRRRITFNISGEIFETYEETLERYPDTLLGVRRKRNLFYDHESGQLYFNRNRICFEAILYFYQSKGRLNCPPHTPIPVFEHECRYYEIPESLIKKMKEDEGIICELDSGNQILPAKNTLRMQIWNILEYPTSSNIAWIYGIFSYVMIAISVIPSFIETIPRFYMHSNLILIELILNIWFLIEIILRFTFSASKMEFARELMNWVDVIAVLPYFVVAILPLDEISLLRVTRISKLVRIVRLFRVSKHSRRLKLVGIILKLSVGNFKLLAMCVGIVLLLSGMLVFYSEQDDSGGKTQFKSVADGLWWSAQTISSVGYGDLVPVTTSGKVLAGCFMMFGVLVYLPVLSMGSQFTALYPKNVECDKDMKKFLTEPKGRKTTGCRERKLTQVSVYPIKYEI